MEGEFNSDQLKSPEYEVTVIPYIKAEFSPDFDSEAADAESLRSCFNGFNYLVHLYKSGLNDRELSNIVPDLYRDINEAIYPQKEVSAEKINPLPEVEFKETDTFRTIHFQDEIAVKTILDQARLFTHSIGNIANAITAEREITEYIGARSDLPYEEDSEPVDVSARLKNSLLHAQELFSNELISSEISIDNFSKRFGAYMRSILDDDRVDLAVMPELEDVWGLLPVHWLSVLASDLAQNIKRKQETSDQRIQTTVIFSLDAESGMLHIKVEDNGPPYPAEFIENGFVHGKGENAGGKHIAMASHSTIAKMAGGKIYAWNDPDEEEQVIYPQTHVLLPFSVIKLSGIFEK